jgi:hypothetical protein
MSDENKAPKKLSIKPPKIKIVPVVHILPQKTADKHD